MATVTTKKQQPARPRKPAAKATSPKTFGDWAKSVSGMAKSDKGDLSTREGFAR